MPIIRRKKGNYHTMSRKLSQDENLSAEALGVMAYLLSKSDDWEAQMRDIERRFKFGKERRIRIIAELERHGYLERQEVRDHGKFDYAMIVHESPLPQNKRTKESVREKQKPHTDEPSTVQPCTGKPSTVKPPTYMNREVQNTDSQKKDLKETQTHTHSESNPQQNQKLVCVSSASRFSKSLYEEYSQALCDAEQGIKNPKGFARTIQKTGQEDEAIQAWLDAGKKIVTSDDRVIAEWKEKRRKESEANGRKQR